MKKRLLTSCMAMASLAVLASCGNEGPAKVEIQDNEGKVTTYEIKATEDKEEVAHTIETVLNSKVDEEELKKIRGINATANADISGKIDVLGTKADVALNANAFFTVAFEKDLAFEGNANASGTVNAQALGTTVETKLSAAADVFTEGKTVYASAKTNLTPEAIDWKYSFDLDAFESYASDKIKESEIPAIMDRIPSTEELQLLVSGYVSQLKYSLTPFLEDYGYSEEELNAYAEGGYIRVTDELHQAILEVVDTYDIVISATTKDTFTVGANIKVEGVTQASVSVTLSSKTYLPLNVTADISAMVPTVISKIVFDTIKLPAITDDEAIAKLVTEAKGTVSLTIGYEAKLADKHYTDGYTAVKPEDIFETK